MKDNREFCLGNFTVEPGKKKSGFLRIGGGEFQLPATILQKAVKQRGMHQPPVSVSKALRQFEGGP